MQLELRFIAVLLTAAVMWACPKPATVTHSASSRGQASIVAPVKTQQRSCTFPGVKARCTAPMRDADIEWREQNGSRPHQLFLRTGSSAKPVLIHEFGRSVDLLWSPDGRSLAITDHAESTNSNVWVVKLEAPNRPANVESAFKRVFGHVPEIYANGHRYFQATAWRSPLVLEFDIKAYDAVPNREYSGHFLYQLDGTVHRR